MTWLSYFVLLGSACVKAAPKMLVKSTPDLFFVFVVVATTYICTYSKATLHGEFEAIWNSLKNGLEKFHV